MKLADLARMRERGIPHNLGLSMSVTMLLHKPEYKSWYLETNDLLRIERLRWRPQGDAQANSKI